MLAALVEINRRLTGAFLVTQHHVSRPVTRADLELTGEVRSAPCPSCGFTSPHPMDVQEGYCGRCHEWHSRVKIMDSAKTEHDRTCQNGCNPKQLYSCPAFVNAVLDQVESTLW